MSGEIEVLVSNIEAFSDDPAEAAKRIRSAVLELLDEVNRLERENPTAFDGYVIGREWHIARYAPEVPSVGETDG